jgi:hypothetical protein
MGTYLVLQVGIWIESRQGFMHVACGLQVWHSRCSCAGLPGSHVHIDSQAAEDAACMHWCIMHPSA